MFDTSTPSEPITSIPKVPRPGSIPQPPPEEAPVEMVPDWNAIGLFAAGIAVGAILGATVTLFLAPASGEETRHRFVNKVRGRDDDDVWEQLAEELDRAAIEIEEEAAEPEAAPT
ncbi:MAG TPA: YtxH domain-containing protein [Gemmatimonadaceae bacterium]|nr:YtxH domain-containing protein [Gemmatimonadaceae bacterium]